MKLLAKFNAIVLVVFLLCASAIAMLSYDFLLDSARQEVLTEAQLMMASAKAVRDYTATNLTPLLNQLADHNARFHPETVPAFGAISTFNKLHQRFPDYLYKEATLNPTNLEDRTTDWEADVVQVLRSNPQQTEAVGERSALLGQELYLASPIRVRPSCLECHSVPAAAPKAMLAQYGRQNGFGWKDGEVIGAQIVSVPMAVPIQIAHAAFRKLLLYLVIMFVATISVLDAAVYGFVIRPIRAVSQAVDRLSMGDKTQGPLTTQGKDEIASLITSFNRMQLSLARALDLLDQ